MISGIFCDYYCGNFGYRSKHYTFNIFSEGKLSLSAVSINQQTSSYIRIVYFVSNFNVLQLLLNDGKNMDSS